MHIMRIAWSSGEKDVIAERMQCYQKKRRWAELGREQDTASRLLSAYGLWRGFADRVVPRRTA